MKRRLSRVDRWLSQGTMKSNPRHRSHVAGWRRMARNKDAQEFLERDEARLRRRYVTP